MSGNRLPFLYSVLLRALLRPWLTPDEIDEVKSDVVDLRAARPGRGQVLYTCRQILAYPLQLGVAPSRVRLPAQHRSRLMTSLVSDFRTALRTLPRAPLLAVMVVTVIALAIAANATIYSVVRTVVLDDLPYPNPEQVAAVWITQQDGSRARMTPGNLLDLREVSVIEAAGTFRRWGATYTPDQGDPEVLVGARVTAGYFEALGREPLHGRYFRADEAVAEGPRVVILGHGFWTRRLGADPRIVGRSVLFDDAFLEVVGIMPAGVYPATASIGGTIAVDSAGPDFWIPEQFGGGFLQNRRTHLFGAVARIHEGVSLEAATVAVAAAGQGLGERYPDNVDEGLLLTSFHAEVTGAVERPLLLLLLTVGAVLLIGATNVAALLLVRAEGRCTELAVRAALGAGHTRLVQLQLVETMLLAFAGGALGLALTPPCLRVVRAITPAAVPRIENATVDLGVVGVAASLMVGVALFSGLVPALLSARGQLAGTLRRGDAGAGLSRGRRRLQQSMVVGQAALAVVLLVATALLARSFNQLATVDLGFTSDRVLTARLQVPASVGQEPEAVVTFMQMLSSRLEATPGVAAVGFAADSPVQRSWLDGFQIAGAELPEGVDPPQAALRRASPEYFATLEIPTVAGRGLSSADTIDAPLVAVVNEVAAAEYFQGNPIGQRIRIPSLERIFGDAALAAEREIVGVVRNVRFLGPTAEHEPALYLPLEQFPSATVVAVVGDDGSRPDLASAVRGVLDDVDRRLGIRGVTPLPALVEPFTAPARFSMLLVGLFGAMGLVLASLAGYALVSRIVASRLREYGIRRALGAPAQAVARGVIWTALAPALAGGGLGLLLAIPVARAMQAQLFETPSLDTFSFVSAPAILLVAALGAATLCLRRALRVDPVEALRDE